MVSLKETEYLFLKKFNNSLSKIEKDAVRYHISSIPRLLKTDEERRMINRLGISFVEGFRLGREFERRVKKILG